MCTIASYGVKLMRLSIMPAPSPSPTAIFRGASQVQATLIPTRIFTAISVWNQSRPASMPAITTMYRPTLHKTCMVFQGSSIRAEMIRAAERLPSWIWELSNTSTPGTDSKISWSIPASKQAMLEFYSVNRAGPQRHLQRIGERQDCFMAGRMAISAGSYG